MSSLCWNCRGLGDPCTVHEIVTLEGKSSQSLFFLMETKVRQDHADHLKTKLNFEGLFYVDGGGVGGGLALLWRDRGIASLISYSKNHIVFRCGCMAATPRG